MKKNRLWTDALREIRNTMGRFLSLFLLSALAVSFLAGLRTTAPDMERSADHYYDEQCLMDIHILSTLGFTDEDIDVLATQTGIEMAEGAYTVDAIVDGGENDFIVKALSISTLGINIPRLVEGRLPATDRECLVEPAFLTSLGLSLGDRITLDTGTGTFQDALKYSTFTIVGTANSPLYISTERGSSSLGSGRVAAFLLLPVSSFTMEAYTDAYLTAQSMAELLSYDEAYHDEMDALIDGLKPLGDTRAANRYHEIIGEANARLSDAQREYDEAEFDAEQTLADARRALRDARKQLDDGWRDYRSGLTDYHREIADAEQKIRDAEQVDLPTALQKLQDGEQAYADGIIDYEKGFQDYQNALTDYQDGLVQYQDGQAEYADGYQEITSQNATYNNSLETLQQGESDYTQGVLDYANGLDRLQSAGKEIQDSERKLQEASDQLFAGSQALSAGQTEYGAQREAYEVGKAQFDAAVSDIMSQYPLPPGMTGDQFLDSLSVLDPQPPGVAELLTRRAQLQGAAQLLEQGQATLDASQSSLRWGQMEYDDGRAQLSDAKKSFRDALTELQDAGKTLKDSRKELDDGWRQLRDGGREMDDAWAELDDAKNTLIDAQRELEDGWQQLQDAQQELLDAKVTLEDSRNELDDGWADYRQGLLDLEEAKATLAEEKPKGLSTLSDALRELQEGEADYADGLTEYEDGQQESDKKLSDARRKLNDARREINNMEHCKWYILGRNANIGYVSFQQDAQRMGNLASVFPVIFFLVAALVCLTTMTRMVEEHRVQIGGLKALGYGKWAISIKYVGYGLAASLLGGVAGLAFGCTVIPAIIYKAWSILYTLGPLKIPFYPAISLLSVGAAVLTVAGAAALTCRATLSAVPAALMRPKAPKSGKRTFLEYVTPVWKRLSFTQKVTVRNLFRYQRRFWMTVIGIGGCTALIITGFGLRDSIFSIMEKQFDEIYSYTSQVGLVDDVTSDELLEIDRALVKNPLVDDFLPAYEELLTAEGAKRSMDASLFVPLDDEAFPSFLRLRQRLSGEAVPLPDDGAVLTEKLATLLGVKVGDQVTLSGEKRVTIQVSGITEHYISHFIYLSPAYYQSVFGASAQENLILARVTEDTRKNSDAVSSSLISLSGVTSVSRIADTRNTYQTSLQSVDYAVVVVIVSAALLAFVVLFNLTNINITERMRELATLKVLGFYNKELGAYVFRENAILTMFGILAGLVMGKFLHQWLVLTVEIDMLMFGRTAKPMSYLYAVLLTLFFSFLVNAISSLVLRKIDMVEALKTVE